MVIPSRAESIDPLTVIPAISQSELGLACRPAPQVPAPPVLGCANVFSRPTTGTGDGAPCAEQQQCGQLKAETVELPAWDLKVSLCVIPSHSDTVTLSHCHTVTLSHSDTVTLSHSPSVTLSHCHTVTLSHCHTVTLSHSQTVTLSQDCWY